MQRIAIAVFIVTGVICGAVVVRAFSKPSVEFEISETLEAPIISETDPSLGPEDAPVTVVHYGHVACDYCRTTHNMVLELIADYPEEVRVIWKDFPNTSLAPESMNAAVAGRCADKQDKFWEYQDILFRYGNDLHGEIYTTLTETAELKTRAFERCYNKRQTEELVLSNIKEAEELELTATPTIFVNDKRFTGLIQAKTLNAAVADALQDL